MRKLLPLLALLAPACNSEEPQNAAEIANSSAAPTANASAPAEAALSNGQAAALEPAVATVGPLNIPYNAALLSPVKAKLPLPPDWKVSVDAMKLVARDRRELMGKAECMYGQSGEARPCNAEQEAGLAFASLGTPLQELSARIPAGQRKSVSFAGAEGVSWEIGAEGEGAEYILLPAGEGTVLIVRQYRTSGNPDEAAIGSVLSDMKLKR